MRRNNPCLDRLNIWSKTSISSSLKHKIYIIVSGLLLVSVLCGIAAINQFSFNKTEIGVSSGINYTISVGGEEILYSQKKIHKPLLGEKTTSQTSRVDAVGGLKGGVGTLINMAQGKSTYLEVKGKWYWRAGPLYLEFPFNDKAQI